MNYLNMMRLKNLLVIYALNKYGSMLSLTVYYIIDRIIFVYFRAFYIDIFYIYIIFCCIYVISYSNVSSFVLPGQSYMYE